MITLGTEKIAGAREVEDQVGQEKRENLLKIHREQLFISKAELARKAGISPATVERIERGKGCHPETKRKIILALGLELSEAEKIFGDDHKNMMKEKGNQIGKN